MRQTQDFNQDWKFIQTDGEYQKPSLDTASWEAVTTPHTWNAIDGQAGGEYYRGRCWYRKEFERPEISSNGRAVLKFEAVQHLAEVYCNGNLVTAHRGGYSTFYADLTDTLQPGNNVVAVMADNSAAHIYPQTADFTFFGGIYRPVTLLLLEENHFSLEKSGSEGVFITPNANGEVNVEAYVSGGSSVSVSVFDKLGQLVSSTSGKVTSGKAAVQLKVDQPHLWQGVSDPTLYTAQVKLDDSDALTINFGFRGFSVDPNEGFFLNGIPTPLRGVSRHQCREDMGYAISLKEHAEDIGLILEMGANSVRLAHYQHAQPFYELCDETGLVVWAEIPFISVFDPSQESYDNTISQMTELILQNYNHASICFWGIANEVGIGGESPELIQNLQALNDLTHQLDQTRLTTIANVMMTKEDSPLNQMTDIIAYNQYLGWYGGKIEDWPDWFDSVHSKLPDRCFGLSEYGAEAVKGWHSDTPKVQDYTEEYQALVHEAVMKAISERPYLWSTYVWNMFDFASAMRDEGGSKGRNNKGLVSFDRKIKKDSFFLYKAYLTQSPFVHITSRRYVQRPHESISVKVYSNCPEVTLVVNQESPRTVTGNKVFVFDGIPLQMGKNVLAAYANGAAFDWIELERVLEPNPDYVLPEKEVILSDSVKQWFDQMVPQSTELSFPEGYCSIQDEIGYLLTIPEARSALEDLVFKPLAMSNMAGGMMTDFSTVLKQVEGLRITDLWMFISNYLPKTVLNLLNERLTQIRKEK